MTTAAYYRKEAERARAAAEASQDAETVMRWLRIAKNYKALADAMVLEEQKGLPPVTPGPEQPQPTQQQQGRLETNQPDEC